MKRYGGRYPLLADPFPELACSSHLNLWARSDPYTDTSLTCFTKRYILQILTFHDRARCPVIYPTSPKI